jgi:hypothetical protein
MCILTALLYILYDVYTHGTSVRIVWCVTRGTFVRIVWCDMHNHGTHIRILWHAYVMVFRVPVWHVHVILHCLDDMYLWHVYVISHHWKGTYIYYLYHVYAIFHHLSDTYLQMICIYDMCMSSLITWRVRIYTIYTMYIYHLSDERWHTDHWRTLWVRIYTIYTMYMPSYIT